MRNEIKITPAFIRAVYDVVAAIPSGRVATYGQVAERAGIPGAAQEVGQIMSRVKAEQNLPCHRVVNKAGTLSPDHVFGGQERQRALLEKEGIRFTGDGHINMVRYQLSEYEQITLPWS